MIKRGRGMASFWYGIGKTGVPNPSTVRVGLYENGRICIHTGAADIGQGSSTVFAQIVAETLNLPLNVVDIISGDTAITPDSGVTSATRHTFVTGKAAKMAAEELEKKILGAVGQLYSKQECSFVCQDEDLRVRYGDTDLPASDFYRECNVYGIQLVGEGTYSPPTEVLNGTSGQGAPYATYAFGTQVAEVEIDTLTGVVKVIDLGAVHDVGKAINPVMAEGQIEGGCVMGIGFALYEDYDYAKIKRAFADYIIPTSMDVPELKSILVEDAEPEGPYGAKGLGEPPVVATAAAIGNAVADALGVRIFSLPITPEKILEAINSPNSGDNPEEGERDENLSI